MFDRATIKCAFLASVQVRDSSPWQWCIHQGSLSGHTITLYCGVCHFILWCLARGLVAARGMMLHHFARCSCPLSRRSHALTVYVRVYALLRRLSTLGISSSFRVAITTESRALRQSPAHFFNRLQTAAMRILLLYTRVFLYYIFD